MNQRILLAVMITNYYFETKSAFTLPFNLFNSIESSDETLTPPPIPCLKKDS